tara:strand:+ start:348 stop:734 length:387 start_codon:yes stop_codon:yes gene_type:complete
MMWDELQKWETRNNAKVFMVITTEEVRNDLYDYNAFDPENEEDFICKIDDVRESLMLEALDHAYETVNYEWGLTFEDINDICYEYIVEKLSSKTKGLDKGQLWNSETKTFESVKDFQARYNKEKNNAS